MTDRHTEARAQAFLFFCILICLAYFHHPVLYDNATSRIALSCSLALEHTTRIDAYADTTEDKAVVGGHTYCDKAPGMSFLGAPILYAFNHISGKNPCEPRKFDALQYILSLILLGIPTALAALMLFRLLRDMDIGIAGAYVMSFSWALGTSVFTYATHFYDHQFAAVLTFAAFVLIRKREKQGGDIGAPTAFACGLLLGWAAITEYTSAVTAVILTMYLIVACKKNFRLMWFIPGAVAPLVLLAVYNHASFGSVFSLGYFHESNSYFQGNMSQGLGGITYPRPDHLYSVLFAPERGIFWGSPFLLAALPGFYFLLKRRERFAVVCLAIVAARLLIVASYYEPTGGFSPSSRFLVPALPFLIPAIAALWKQAGPAWRGAIAGLCVQSAAVQFLLNAIEPHVPPVFTSPLIGYGMRLLQLGFPPVNAGTKSGFSPTLSLLLPALMITLFSVFAVATSASKSGRLKSAASALIVAALALTCYFSIGRSLRPSSEHLAYFYLGVAMNQSGRPDSAAAEFQAAIRSKPNFARAHFHLGTAYVKMRRYDSAAAQFREVVHLQPEDFRSRLSLAAAEMLAGHWDASQKDVDAALRMRPDDPLARHLDTMLKSQSAQ